MLIIKANFFERGVGSTLTSQNRDSIPVLLSDVFTRSERIMKESATASLKMIHIL